MELACPYCVAGCLYMGDFAQAGVRMTQGCKGGWCLDAQKGGVKMEALM